MNRTIRVALTVALACLFLVPSARAQRRRLQGQALPQPTLTSIFPLGVAPGGAAEIAVRGTDLEGATQLWFSHPGLRAFHVKGPTFKVVAGSGVPLGHHDVRAVGTYGITNPRTLVVGGLHESTEVEPNNVQAQASPITVNAVANAEIGPADVDFFAFDGKKGQRLRIDLEAERIDSRLDATIRLMSPQGRELAESRDAFGADPFLDVELPEDGRYAIKVHDVIYRGSNEYPYRLTLSDGPWVDAVSPQVMSSGQTAEVTIFGRGLGGEAVPGMTVDGRPIERKAVTVTAPNAAETDPDAPSLGFVDSASGGRRGFDYVYESPNGRSNPVFIALATDPVVLEKEPNDGESFQEVTLPCDVAGRFDRPGDMDIYRFRAKKGEVWWVEASAERIGSPADPALTIQKVDDKGATSDLATGDDLADKGAQTRFGTATVDAAVRFTVPDDGTYQVAVSDLYGSQRGDVRLSYRLNLRPERPDFDLFVVPNSPTQLDSLVIRAGGRSAAYVFASRRDGFNGPIRVEAFDLPPGVSCAPVVVPPDQSLTPIVFEASEDCKPVLGTIRLVGRARHGDRKDELNYTSGATRLGPDLARGALAGGVVWPGTPPNRSPARLTRGLPLKVVGPSPLAVNARPDVIKTTPGGLVTVDLSVARREGFAEAVAFTLVNPLPGIPDPKPTANVPKDGATGLFAMTVPKTLTAGEYSLVFQGSGPWPFSKDPAAKTKPNVTVNELTRPVTLVVRPAPAVVALKPKGPNVKRGGTLEVEATVTLKGASEGPFLLSLQAPTGLNLSAEPVVVVPGTPATLVLKAGPEGPVGGTAGVGARLTVPVRGESVEVVEPFALTIDK